MNEVISKTRKPIPKDHQVNEIESKMPKTQQNAPLYNMGYNYTPIVLIATTTH